MDPKGYLSPEKRLTRDLGEIFARHLENLGKWCSEHKDSDLPDFDNGGVLSDSATQELSAIFAETFIKIKNLTVAHNLEPSNDIIETTFQKYLSSERMMGDLQLAALALALGNNALAIQAIHRSRGESQRSVPAADFQELDKSIKAEVMNAWVHYVSGHYQPSLNTLIQRRVDPNP